MICMMYPSQFGGQIYLPSSVQIFFPEYHHFHISIHGGSPDTYDHVSVPDNNNQ